MKLSKKTVEEFQHLVSEYYIQHGRDLLWRRCNASGELGGYGVLVSEFMLQQTQVLRVTPKYRAFMEQFPTISCLASATLGDVLKMWTGLGYNRRAKYLHDAAKHLRDIKEPWTFEQLVTMKGIGPNTAKAVLVYAYNRPEVFIETNTRTVYLQCFFPETDKVTDKEIEKLLAQTIITQNPREFYWALMDYGSMLKRTSGNASRRSSTFKTQSTFDGSRRQVRGQVIKLLSKQSPTNRKLESIINDVRLSEVLKDLCKEGLIILSNNRYKLP